MAKLGQAKKEAEKFIKQYLDVWSNYDSAALNNLIANDNKAAHIGTDSDEYVIGKSALMSRVRAIEKTGTGMISKVRSKQLTIHSSGNAAHFGLKIDAGIYKNGKLIKKIKDVRTTGFLVKEKGEWKLAGSHVSLPAKGRAVKY